MIKILVVDDMKTVRVQVAKICRELGVQEVIEASDGLEAWQKLDQNPDVKAIISDFNMPNLTGEELLAKVKGDPRTKDIPFVFVTAESEKEKVLGFLKMGVTGYVVKPFSHQMLKDKLKTILQQIWQA